MSKKFTLYNLCFGEIALGTQNIYDKKNRMKIRFRTKRLLSILLTLCLLFTLMPITVFAADAPTNLRWEGNVAHWEEVAGATAYLIIVDRDTDTVNTEGVTSTFLDCSEIMSANGAGTYTFTVAAMVDGSWGDESPSSPANPVYTNPDTVLVNETAAGVADIFESDFSDSKSATKGTSDQSNAEANVGSTSSVGFPVLRDAIKGTSDQIDADAIEMNEPSGIGESYADGTKFYKKGDDTVYFGYSWNNDKGWWDIEAWNENTTRNLKLNADANDTDKTTILISSQTVTLDLNGHTITGTGAYVLGVNVGTIVTVTDNSAGAKGSIIGDTSTSTVINDYGTFHLESGTVHAKKQRGISVAATGTATISAGAVVETDDTTTNGRAVNVSSNVNSSGSLTTSGEIRSKCIGIYTNGGSVKLTGGTVNSDQYGVYANKSSVTLTGGTVNSGQYGVYAKGGSVTLTDGTVNSDKHGVYVFDKATFDMSGGKVTADTVAVYILWGATGTVTGGEISAKKPLDQYGNGTMAIGVMGYQTVDGNGVIQGEPYGKTTLTVSGGTVTGPNFAISGNGSVHKDKGYSNGGTVINIKESAEIHGDGVGIYHPQAGELNITGGNITADLTGVEMRAGNLNMSGGTVTGGDTILEGDPNSSGSTVEGAGLSVSQHTTKQDININISGGTIKGYTSFYEDSFQDNTSEDLAKVNLKITGGKFVSTGESSAFSKHKDTFITAGMYSQPVGMYTYGNGEGDCIDHLGSLTQEEMAAANIQSTLENPTGKVNCIKVKNSELPYHVGYLTGEPSPSFIMNVGSKSDPLVPKYKLNGAYVAGDVVCAVFVNVDNVNQINENVECPVIKKWTSENEAVATVDENGVVTAVSASSSPVAITATLINGETVTFHVTVIDEAPPVPAYYIVTFNMNGHGTQVAYQIVKDGSKATKPTDPTEEGWTFDGWYTDAAFSAVFDFNTAITADTTIYAKWSEVKKDEPTETIDPGEGTKPPEPTETIDPGEGTKPPEPTETIDPGEGTKPPEPTETIDPGEGTKPPEPTETIGPGEETKPSEPARTVEPTKSAESNTNTKETGPQTGDNSNLFLWSALFFVSGFAGIFAFKKKRIIK